MSASSMSAFAAPVVAAPRRARRSGNALIWAAVVILGAVVLCGLFAPQIAPYPPGQQDLQRVLVPPYRHAASGTFHLLGTDVLGRDIASRLIFGAQISLLVGVLTVLVRGGLGVLLGLVAGFYRGRVDDVIMRIGDVQLALPLLVVAIAIMSVLGPGVGNLVFVLGFTGWMIFGRVVRSQALSVREREFVLAARAAGAADWHILRRHVLPNTASAVLVIATLQVAQVIVTEASLSFLGLGVGPRTPTWGQMIADGRQYLGQGWWLSFFPGLAIFLTVLSINLIGDGLRDRTDPRLRGTR